LDNSRAGMKSDMKITVTQRQMRGNYNRYMLDVRANRGAPISYREWFRLYVQTNGLKVIKEK